MTTKTLFNVFETKMLLFGFHRFNVELIQVVFFNIRGIYTFLGARLVGTEKIATSVTHILDVFTETAEDRGNVTASRAGEEFYAIKVMRVIILKFKFEQIVVSKLI